MFCTRQGDYYVIFTTNLNVTSRGGGGNVFVVFGDAEPKILKQGIRKRKGMLNGNQKTVLVNIIAYIRRTGIWFSGANRDVM